MSGRFSQIRVTGVVGFLIVVFAVATLNVNRWHARSSLASLHALASPAPSGSIAPRLASFPDGDVLLSWLEPHGEVGDLLFARWGDKWSPPTRIAAGLPFATHPSEAPGIIVLSRKNLIAYWTQHADNREKYPQETDVLFAVSSDGGLHWSAPTFASPPQTNAESSYASGAAIDGEHAALVWLDGRDSKAKKRVTLRSGIVESDGSLTDPRVVDEDTCTCCPTASVSTGTGVMTAYRDHTSANIRDIATLSYSHGVWTPTNVVHPDGWQIAGCPVNGPALDSDGNRVAIAWYTAAGGHAAVQVETSSDGKRFSSPVRVDLGNPVGRAKILLNTAANAATVFWLENEVGLTRLLARSVPFTGDPSEPFEIARGHGLGFPQVARTTRGVFVTWTTEEPDAGIRVGRFDTSENSR